MSTTMEAAAAAEAGFASNALRELIETGEATTIHARDLLLRLHAIAGEQRDVKALKKQIVDRYDHKLARLAEEEAEVRASLEEYVRRINDGEKVSIPDAGTAYLTTKNKGGKLIIADGEALLEFLKRRFPRIVEATTVTTVVLPQALELAIDELAIRATPEGKVMDTSSGEVVELPGIGAEPESKTLAVKKA